MIGQKNHATIYAIRELVCKQFDVVFEDFTDTKKRTKQIVDALTHDRPSIHTQENRGEDESCKAFRRCYNMRKD